MREGYLDFSFDFKVQNIDFRLFRRAGTRSRFRFILTKGTFGEEISDFWINQPLSSLENFSRNPHRSTFASRSDWVTSMPCAIEINEKERSKRGKINGRRRIHEA